MSAIGRKADMRFALQMSAFDPKRTLQRGSLSEGNVAAPSAWQQITVCSNCPSYVGASTYIAILAQASPVPPTCNDLGVVSRGSRFR